MATQPPVQEHAGVDRDRAHRALHRATGSMCTAAMGRMDTAMPWFGELSAEDRSWVGLVVQAGIRGFVSWYAAQDQPLADRGLAAALFGSTPRALAGVINLQQTVDLVRLSIEVVEGSVEQVVDRADATDVREAVLRYAREVAFATAEVHARAAEVRGAWDARLEALVVDSVLRAEAEETMLSRASALGWAARGGVVVVLGAPPPRREETDVFVEVRELARRVGMDALCATQGDRLVIILGGVTNHLSAARVVADLFAPGPVVVGPVTDSLAEAHISARSAMSALRAAAGWPMAPRPVSSDELLPERALAGDGHARRHLVDHVYLPLARSRGALLDTASCYLEHGGSIEATARAMFVHPNTIRYRLRLIGEETGLTLSAARDAFTMSIALVLGRQSGRRPENL